MPTSAEVHRVGFKGPHVAHACGAPLGGDIESDTYKRISREAHAARTQHRLLSSGAIGRDAPWAEAPAPAPAGVAGQAWLDRQDRGGPSTYRRLQTSALQPEEREEKQRRNKRGKKKASSSTAAILSGRVSVVSSSGSSASSASSGSGSSGSTGKRPLWKRALLRGF